MRRTAFYLKAMCLAGTCLALSTGPLHAQQPTAVDSLRAQLRVLQAQLDSMRALVATLRVGAAPDTMDALARIRAAAAAAAGADTMPPPAASPTFVSQQRNLNALNPEISVTGDVFLFANTQSAGKNNFVPREFEVALQSNLDPLSRAKVFVAHHTPGGEILPFTDEGEEEEESGIEVEEGYAEWVNLPGGVGLTLGKFRQRIGKLNRWHAHALPAQQLPLPYLAFTGEEGLGQPGLSVHWLIPVHGLGTHEVWGEVTRSSNESLYGADHGVSGLGRLNSFWQLSPATYFEVGVALATGGYEAAEGEETAATPSGNRLLSIDFTLDWRPPERSLYRQATLHGGALFNRRVIPGAADLNAKGAFAVAEYRFTRRWIGGVRGEYTEDANDPDRHAWLVAPLLTWWQSEFVRLRAEYEHFRGPTQRFGLFVIQATFAMGPHKHETY
jgi:hypothetical protein